MPHLHTKANLHDLQYLQKPLRLLTSLDILSLEKMADRHPSMDLNPQPQCWTLLCWTHKSNDTFPVKWDNLKAKANWIIECNLKKREQCQKQIIIIMFFRICLFLQKPFILPCDRQNIEANWTLNYHSYPTHSPYPEVLLLLDSVQEISSLFPALPWWLYHLRLCHNTKKPPWFL